MAGETDLAAVAAWEPATVLFCGLMTKDFRGSEEDKNTKSIMADPGKCFTAQHRQLTREKLSKIRCPVIVTHGDVSALKKINFEFFFPELMNAGKKVTISIHPGMPHGLSWYSAEGRIEKLQRTFEKDEAFFRRFLFDAAGPNGPLQGPVGARSAGARGGSLTWFRFSWCFFVSLSLSRIY